MPISRREVFQLSLLLLSVPFQFWLTKQLQQPNSSRSKAFTDVIDETKLFATKWLNPRNWITLCNSFVSWIVTGSMNYSDYSQDESPALEVLEFREKQMAGHFASSMQPRDERDGRIHFRVGQIVHHVKNGYRGVIVGWDYAASAPEHWISKNYGHHSEWLQQPNYLILVDTRDRQGSQLTYVPQENLLISKPTRIKHPKLLDYFSSYDGAQYIPRPWLQEIYPQD